MSTDPSVPAESETPASKVVLDHWPTPLENATLEFERHAGQLLPGAAPVLGKMMAAQFGVMAPDRRAEAVAKFLASPTAARWLDPEVKASTLENGQSPSPLRRALTRYAPELKPGAVDALVGEWSVGTAHLPPEKLAGEVVRRLGRAENAHHLVSPIDKVYAHAFGQGRSTPAPAKTEPARQPDGRFATPPADKSPRLPSSF